MAGKSNNKSRETTDLVSAVEAGIHAVRDERVILDSDLAALFGVETRRLNEQVKRNRSRFGRRYVFQLTREEYDDLKSQIATSKTGGSLKSQNATSKSGRGGRRTPPWAFTEHGVVMAATVINSEAAIEATRLVVDVFVEVRRRLEAGKTNLALPARTGEAAPSAIERISGAGKAMGERLQKALDMVLDTIVDPEQQTTVRKEAQTVINESIKYLKDRLKKPGLENEEIAARVTRLLAQAEKEKALTAKTREETVALRLTNNARKLRLLLEAQRMVETGSMDGFLNVLGELG